MKQHFNSKRYLPTKLHGVTLQKTVILSSRPTFWSCIRPLEHTGWSKSLCTPDDYNTESYKLCSKCPPPVSRHLLTRRTVFSKIVFSITRSTFRMYKVVQIWPGLFVCKQGTVCPGHIWTTLYSVMAIVNSSIVWGLFEYTEFFIAPQVHRDFLITLYFCTTWSIQTSFNSWKVCYICRCV